MLFGYLIAMIFYAVIYSIWNRTLFKYFTQQENRLKIMLGLITNQRRKEFDIRTTTINECINDDNEDRKALFNDDFKFEDCFLDLRNQRNARYWLLLRDYVLSDQIALDGVGKAIKSISIVAVAVMCPIIYMVKSIYLPATSERDLTKFDTFVTLSICLYLYPVIRKFNQAADLIFMAKDVYLETLKNLRYKLL